MSEEVRKDITSELVVEIVPPEETTEAAPGELVITKAAPETEAAEVSEAGNVAAETKVLPTIEAAEAAEAGKEAAAAEMPAAEAPAAEAPAADAPTAEMPTTEIPTADAPTTEIPTAEIPAAEMPTTEIPTAEIPTEEIPAADMPAEEIAVADVAPAEEVSAAETANSALAEEVTRVMQGKPPAANPEAVPAYAEAVSQTAEEMEEEEEQPRKKLPRAVKILIGVLIGVAALACVYVWFCFYGVGDDIQRQTSINNVDITGMTVDEAREAVQQQFENEYKDAAYEVTVGDRKFSVPVYSALSFDASAEVEQAYELCHGEWYTRGYEYLKNMYYPEDAVEISILPEVSDTSDIQKSVQKIADEIASSVTQSSWNYDGNQVTIQMGTHGESVDPEKIYNEILAGLRENRFSGSASGELVLAEPDPINPEEIVKAVDVAPVDAKYELQDGQVVVTPSSQGAKISAEEIAAQLASAPEGGTITMEKTVVEPTVSEETLQAELFRDTITVYEVPDGGSYTQKNNQGLACEAINGTIIMPGEVFSFNDVVGDTTPEKGYVEDYAYSEGRLVTQYGGGVCRVASTLYAAVLNSNLETVMRYNHSSPVHYLPLGMDATVSYPLPDLRFKNNQGHPIKIIMWLDGGVVHAEILGTVAEDDPVVEVELDPITDMRVDTYRLYYDRQTGELLQKEYMHTSVYKELIRDEEPASSSGGGEIETIDYPEEPEYVDYGGDTGDYGGEGDTGDYGGEGDTGESGGE